MPVLLDIQVERNQESTEPPEHHVVASSAKPGLGWSSYLPAWSPSPDKSRPLKKQPPIAFRNPWPSFHKPTRAQIWDNLQWGDEPDPCIDLAASRLADLPPSSKPPSREKRPGFADVTNWPNSTGAKATRLLGIETPDFSFPQNTSTRAKVTWLGHATVLVQLPPLCKDRNARPVACLFDPIFSMRCSPSRMMGPIRSYPPPCKVDSLPLIDAVFISHNHFDHLDQDTIMALWEHNKKVIRFFAPLGNRKWFIDCGIPDDRVSDLDWWESATLNHPHSDPTRALKIWCTPAQHGSGRLAGDANTTLWSSWFLEYSCPEHPPYRVFFAGDTGYQFHASPAWPPSPSKKETRDGDSSADDDAFPACPAFAEVRTRLGPSNLLLLPISVGATYAYLRSFVFLPDSINPFPRHSPGLTGAIHMPAWDAVRVLNVMAGGGGEPAVAVAMHWGTFVTDAVEVLRTLGQLDWACQKQGVVFRRSLDEPGGDSSGSQSDGDSGKSSFLALNHGQSICIE